MSSSMKSIYDTMQVACLSGGFLCRVTSTSEAQAAERLGAVGILLDTTDDFREILSVISVHPLTLGSIGVDQASLLSSMDVPDSFTFVTAPHDSKPSRASPERFVLELPALENIPEEFEQEIMIVCTSNPLVLQALYKKRASGKLDIPIFGIVQDRSALPNDASMNEVDGFMFQFVPDASQVEHYQQLFLRASSSIQQAPDTFHIGVVSVQGDYRIQASEMVSAIERCDESDCHVETHLVRTVGEMEQCDALILPGGWSNLQSSIFDATGIGSALQRFDESGKPILAVCAGMILAGARPGKDCASRRLLGIADVTIENNTVNGEHVVIDSQGQKFQAVFSNGPVATELGATIERLAWLEDGNAVVIRDNNVLISACHSGEIVHATFLEMCQRKWSLIHTARH